MAREMKDSGAEWIGEIPADWEVRNVRVLFSFGKGLPITKDNLCDAGVAVISYGQIHSKKNPGTRLEYPLFRYVGEEYLNSHPSSLACRGDFIFADTSEDLDGCGNCAYVDVDMTLFAGYHTIILRSKNDADNRYFAYLFKSDGWRKQIREQVTGVKLFSVSQKILKSLSLIVPPKDTQCAIADYLDRKCAKIDTVLERTLTSIEEYKKLKQAIITQAVTKGIRGDRPMKESGIEWAGQIPADWSINLVFQLFRQVKNKNDGMKESNLLSLSYGRIKRRNIDAAEGLLPESFEGYNIIEANDIVLRLTDLQNDQTSLRVGLSTERGIVTSAYLTIRNLGGNIAKYLYYFLHAFDVSKGFYGMGGGVRQGLNWDGVKDIKITIPPIDEQREICEYLDAKCDAIDYLIAQKQLLVSQVEGYKKSLIYEYVTGKKEV